MYVCMYVYVYVYQGRGGGNPTPTQRMLGYKRISPTSLTIYPSG